MSSKTSLMVLFVFLILEHHVAFAWDSGNVCGTSGNYTSNGIYATNLNNLLSSLSTNVDDYGFYNTSVGNSPNRVNAIALCKGDIQLDTCRNCIQNATFQLIRSCPNQMDAIFWDPNCMVRYSNEVIVGIMATSPWYHSWYYQKNVTSPSVFSVDLRTLVDDITGKAASSLHKVAAGLIKSADFQTIYAYVQCTPDLTQEDCSNCLLDAAKDMSYCCSASIGVHMYAPSCILFYELNPFFNESRLQELDFVATPPDPTSSLLPSLPTPSPTSDRGPGNGDNQTIRIIIILGSCAAGIVVVISLIFLLKRIRSRTQPINTPKTGDEFLKFDFGKIRLATNNFAEDRKLGQGGFGAVYKGKLSNGQTIAVKRLSRNSKQGDDEFKNEIVLHNGSLDRFIFDPTRRSRLDWKTRRRIIGGIAKGLLYLHEDSQLKIIHRDLKPGNILLDREMKPKIADFGMARLFDLDKTQCITDRIVGTLGYMAPEYIMHGNFSVKTDVFSFGVLILEIISGQKNDYFHMGNILAGPLITSAWNSWLGGTHANLIDHALGGKSVSPDVSKCIQIGLLCVHENASARPTIESVVQMLNDSNMVLKEPTAPYLSPNGHVF